MIKKYFGRLTMPEGNLTEITYVLVNDKLNCSFNLSTFLKKNQGKEIGLVVNIYNKDIICEAGTIEIIGEVYEINGYDISNKLWSLVGNNINIIVDDMEEES